MAAAGVDAANGDRPSARSGGAKYDQRRTEFIDAASRVMNENGLRGMTLASVATQLGMTTPSVRHYFKRKEELATACMLRGIERIEGILVPASSEPAPALRVRRFVHEFFALLGRISDGQEPPLANFGEIRALEGDNAGPVTKAYSRMVGTVRTMFEHPETAGLTGAALQARVMYSFVVLTWVPAWIHRFPVQDYPLLADGFADILLNGLCSRASREDVPVLPDLTDPLPTTDVRPISQETYLNVATRLLNEQGYRGASVDMIAARLGVTKGAIYHHHAGKGDLVSACFERSYGIIWRAQDLALQLDTDGWSKLTAVCAAIARFQISDEGPLLNNAALSALPIDEATRLISSWSKTCDRFAMIIGLGIRDGSIAPVDANIAAQFVYAGLNAINRLPYWHADVAPEEGVELVVRPMLQGLFSRPFGPVSSATPRLSAVGEE